MLPLHGLSETERRGGGGNEQGVDEWKGTRRGRKTEGGKWTQGRKETVKTTGQDEEWKKGQELTEEGNVEKEQKEGYKGKATVALNSPPPFPCVWV